MAKGANGTIDLSTFIQVTKQREAITDRNTTFGLNKPYGVGTDRLNSLFASSPINQSVRQDITNDRGGLYTNASGDVYKAYAAAVDNDVEGGFGFTDTVNLDYRGPNLEKNPFLNDAGNTDYNSLTTGETSTDVGDKRRFFGFPDLQIPDQIDGGNIAYSDATLSSSSALNKTPTNNFGSTTIQDRAVINRVYSGTDLKGTFEADTVSDAIDTLGKYFTKNYTN